jgi:hypothetical protein
MPACATCAPLRPRGSHARSTTPHRRVRLDHPRGREAIRITDAILYQPADCLACRDGTKIDRGAKSSLYTARPSSVYFSGRHRTQHNPNCSDPHRPGRCATRSSAAKRGLPEHGMRHIDGGLNNSIRTHGEGRQRARRGPTARTANLTCVGQSRAHGQSRACTHLFPAHATGLRNSP